MRFDRALCVLSLTPLALIPAAAQSIISARSGVVNFSEGDVLIDGRPAEQKFGTFPEIKEGSELRTVKGRAEILLTPGVYLRVGEGSAIRMNSTMLVDTQLDFLNGSAMVEVAEKPNGTSVTMFYHGYRLRFPSQGMFRINSDPEEFRVLDGEAEISYTGEKRVLGRGHLVSLAGGLVTETFTPSIGDGLYEWSMRRSGQMALANTPPDPADGLGSLGGFAGGLSGGVVGGVAGGTLPDGSWVTSPFSGISTYVPSYDATLSRLGIGYASLYSPYGFYWGGYSRLYGRPLGSSYYRAPPGHVTHGTYGGVYTPVPVYRPPMNTGGGFGRASHPITGGGAIPSGAAVRAPAAAAAPRGAAGHR